MVLAASMSKSKEPSQEVIEKIQLENKEKQIIINQLKSSQSRLEKQLVSKDTKWVKFTLITYMYARLYLLIPILISYIINK